MFVDWKGNVVDQVLIGMNTKKDVITTGKRFWMGFNTDRYDAYQTEVTNNIWKKIYDILPTRITFDTALFDSNTLTLYLNILFTEGYQPDIKTISDLNFEPDTRYMNGFYISVLISDGNKRRLDNMVEFQRGLKAQGEKLE